MKLRFVKNVSRSANTIITEYLANSIMKTVEHNVVIAISKIFVIPMKFKISDKQ